MIPNGKFTFTNSKGEHRTFQVKTQDKEAKFAPGKRVVALLTGPDNESDYLPFGFVEEAGVRLWSTKMTPAYKWFARMLTRLGDLAQPDTEEIKGEFVLQHAGQEHKYIFSGSKRCLVCNRELTDPESIRLQIGPVCRGGAA